MKLEWPWEGGIGEGHDKEKFGKGKRGGRLDLGKKDARVLPRENLNELYHKT